MLRCTWKRICVRRLLGKNISPLVLKRTFVISPVNSSDGEAKRSLQVLTEDQKQQVSDSTLYDVKFI